MEVGVRIIGIFLRLLNILLTPIFWLRPRDKRRLPPIKNELLLKSATELAAAIRNEEVSSEEVVKTFIDRVQEVNPYINAVVDERYRAALEDAKAVDRMLAEARKDGTWNLKQLEVEKPFLGVPFTVKESCSVAGLSNAVGCLEWAGRRASHDGGAVANARLAGAIPLLVSNCPELCLGWETTNLLKGRTNNPYDLDRTCGGSSGGEAALVSSAASPFGVASDIAGSIRVPAAFCGLYGHKPTPGIIPTSHHVPLPADPRCARLLCCGPLSRSARDLAPLVTALAGPRAAGLRLGEPVDMAGLQVFYMTEAFRSLALAPPSRDVTSAVTHAARYLKTRGCRIREEKFKGFEDSVEISISEFFSMKDLPNLLQDPADPKRDKSLLMELLKSIFGGGSRTLQGLGFTLIQRSRLFIPDSRQQYYCDKGQILREELERTLGDNGVLLYPCWSSAAPRHGGSLCAAPAVLYSMLLNVLGAPAAVVPAPSAQGKLPVALQVIAAPNQDRLCLAVAEELEKGLGGWRPSS